MAQQNFEQTNLALDALKQSVDDLFGILNAKKNGIIQQKESYRKNIEQKNAKIDMLTKAIENAAEKINQSVQKIDEVTK